MKIGERIKKRREALGMTQEELAEKLGYKSKSSINKIELGKTDVPRAKVSAFASALGMTEPELSGWDEEQISYDAHYLIERLMRLVDCRIEFDYDEGMLMLMHDGAAYEIGARELQELEDRLMFVLRLSLLDLIKNSKPIGGRE